MAGENEEGFEEGQLETEQTQTDDLAGEGDESSEENQEESSSSSDSSGADRATEERLKRLEERNQYLENTQRILDQFNQQQSGRQPQRQVEEPALPDDVAALDKLLEPAVNRRFKQGLEPLIGTISELKEENDASKFENFLNRTESELFDPDNEQKLNTVYQQVDNFRRQIAQQRGQWISRQDAYLYLSGVERAKEKLASRKAKGAQTQIHEKQRVQQAKVATSLDRVPNRQDNSADAGLVKKLRGNQRLTPDELEKLRNGPLGDVEF